MSQEVENIYACRRVPADLMFRLYMVFSNVTAEISISCRLFVFSQSRVSELAVAAFDPVH